MTIERLGTVKDILRENPDIRIYKYTHALTGEILYAVFPHGQYDDMYESPMVRAPVLLYDCGVYTISGIVVFYNL